MLPMFKEVASQVFKKPKTNLFPAKYLPKSINVFLKDAQSGKVKITPPVESPKDMRGKLIYDRNTCNGCGLCIKVCPAHAIEHVIYPAEEGEKPQKRIRIYVSSCIFCGQCIDMCPRKAISQSDDFFLASDDRFSESLIIE